MILPDLKAHQQGAEAVVEDQLLSVSRESLHAFVCDSCQPRNNILAAITKSTINLRQGGLYLHLITAAATLSAK